MARRDRPASRALRLVMLVVAGLALVARRRGPTTRFQAVLDPIEEPPAPPRAVARPRASRPPARRRVRRSSGSRPRRVVGTFAIAVCFFAGAALSAGAGDRAVVLLDDVAGEEALPLDTTETTETAVEPADDAELLPPTQGSSAAEAVPAEVPPTEPATPPAEPALPADPDADAEPAAPRLGSEAPAAAEPPPAAAPESAARAVQALPATARPVPAPTARPARPSLELASGVVSGHTYWLARPFVETPPALRLSPAFAEHLRATARKNDARWSVLFGVLRAGGAESAAPASARELRALAVSLAGVSPDAEEISAALGRPARSDFGERAAALARYARAVGLDTLVEGLEESRKRLGERILADERVDLYPGGREDVTADRIDPRVLALVSYLAETYGQVTVSSLTSGHRLYSRPGVLSAHVFGQAVDVAALGGVSVLGNQQPGGLVEHAVRSILRLPSDLRPEQVISLLGLGGPSFPLADHADHIHVGY